MKIIFFIWNENFSKETLWNIKYDNRIWNEQILKDIQKAFTPNELHHQEVS